MSVVWISAGQSNEACRWSLHISTFLGQQLNCVFGSVSFEGRESKLMRKQNPLYIHPSFISGGVLCDCVGWLAVEGGQKDWAEVPRDWLKRHSVRHTWTGCWICYLLAEKTSDLVIALGGTEETGYSRIKQLQVASWLKWSVHHCFVLNSEINNYIMRNDLGKSETIRLYKQW